MKNTLLYIEEGQFFAESMTKKTLTIAVIMTLIFANSAFNSASADDFQMERVTYSEDYDSQPTLDEELFDEESEYEDYVVYSDAPEEEEDTTEMIVLAPEKKTSKMPVLQATVEKSYSFRSVEAFHAIWDNSENFRTLYRTVPSMMETAPSIIHAANYKFSSDEQTSVYWGHSSLSSSSGESLGFISKLESSYDSGMKIATKAGRLNISAGIYNSLETNNPSGGIVISSDDLKIKHLKGTFNIGGGFYANEYENNASANSGGIFARYTQGRFSLGVQAGSTQYSDSSSKYGTSFYIMPSYKLTDTISLKSKIAGHLEESSMQEEFGITYKPFKYNSNDFSVSLNTTFKNGRNSENKQTFEVKTEFKL